MKRRIPLSDIYLKQNGWAKGEGLEWWKGLNRVQYDGCFWMYFKYPDCITYNPLNGVEIKGKKVRYIHEIV